MYMALRLQHSAIAWRRAPVYVCQGFDNESPITSAFFRSGFITMERGTATRLSKMLIHLRFRNASNV